MSYFSDSYESVRYPIGTDTVPGFRLAQLAATHAISAHFFTSALPAIITMPTGSGKTTVLTAVPFLLQAKRVLVLTPSRLVREQIAENFKLLLDLKKINALAHDFNTPKVFATAGTIGSKQAWDTLQEYDVVVATVPSVSPRDGAIPEPPADLFDLVLVDEAHHAPARTWARLLDLLKSAKQILFTATPFRRDDKQIRGRFVFTYDLRRAHKDRVFGEITFQPVLKGEWPSVDVAIAKATEAKLAADRSADLKHLVMVRADSLSRGKELEALYRQNTRLRLAFVSGKNSLKSVKKVITNLKAGELDGIICVNMFGEGFNLPNLKIAAVHSPHKSLAITLQFIGRFARTGDRTIGGATFLAEPKESSPEISELYETGAVWRDIIQNLSEARIEEEAHIREVIDSFETEASPDMDDFSLYSVRPYSHAKIFAAPNGVDFESPPPFPESMQVIFQGISDPHGAAIYLTRETIRSRWSSDERFTNVEYDLFIFHYNANARLLFICASRRETQLYLRLGRGLLGGRPRPLASATINRALNDLEDAEFFNVGMRKRHPLGRTESYRIIAGPSADRAIQASDGRLFDRGHCFGKGTDEGVEVTIGVSTASKVWSNTYSQVPELLDWCDSIAGKIASGRNTATASGLDHLSVGEELNQLPAGIIAMRWPVSVYRAFPFATYHRSDGRIITRDMLDFELAIVQSQDGSVQFSISNHEITWRGIFSLTGEDYVIPATDTEPTLAIHIGDEDFPIAEFLNNDAPTFFTSDLSSIEGNNIFRPVENLDPIEDAIFEVIDWAAGQVDIEKEKPDGQRPVSIFEWLEVRLSASSAAFIFCDDGPGEIADYIAITGTERGVTVSFYHCKASGSARAGARVADLYEVCGQSVKSSMWMKHEALLNRFGHRAMLSSIRGYVRGDINTARELLRGDRRLPVEFEIFVVQPGVSSAGRSPEVSQLLAATNHYLVQGGIDRFRVLSS